jgi:hypothetical protein
MLDDRFGLADVISANYGMFGSPGAHGTTFEQGFLHCGKCGARRRMRTEIVYSHAREATSGFSSLFGKL